MNLPEHPAWSITDSSKMDDYDRCPRYYFYRHVLGWHLDIPAHDLVYGQAWHNAREYQLINGYEEVEGAFMAFLTHYREYFPETSDINFRPKTPEAAYQALINFGVTYPTDLDDNELLRNPDTDEPFTEISGTVPIDDKRVLHFRMDSILRRKEDGMIFSWDHKTTSGRWIGNYFNEMAFNLSNQNGTYTHCLYCLFPIEQVLGVEFCGTGFEYLSRGSKARPPGYYSTLKRVPAFRSPDQMNTWLWNTLDRINDMERDFDQLSHCSENDEVMTAFRMNPGGCGKYRGCEFFDYCNLWPNPLRQCQEPPFGFVEKFWDPRELDSRNKMQLEWK
jgi:hypothetical protein